MQWIESPGGPLLVLPTLLASEWSGADSDDYARACSVGAAVGVVSVGSGAALVLGDEPLETSWLASPASDGGVLVRWIHADSDASVADHLRGWHDLLGWTRNLSFQSMGDSAYLMPAADNAADPKLPRMEIPLVAGKYSLGTLRFSPEPRTVLVLHQLRRDRAT
jgi:hypothetical protein